MNDKCDWQESGDTPVTEAQKRMLNAVCGDLAQQIDWYGNKMDKDDWRHFLSGTAKGWRMMPAYNRGEGAPGFIMLGGSSLKLTKSQGCDAITMGLDIGDNPTDQGLKSQPVRWCRAVLCGLGFSAMEAA